VSELNKVIESIASTYSSSGEDNIVSPLRKSMSELDYALPDFPYEDGHRIKDCIDKVWDEIDKLEGRYERS